MEEEKTSVIEELKKGMFLVFGDTEFCVRLRYDHYDRYLPIEEQIDVKIGGKKIKNVKKEDVENIIEFFKKINEIMEKIKKEE